MTWFMLKDGWRDESSEGPYTDTLQTKDGWEICRLTSPHRESDKYTLRNHSLGIREEFDTVEAAKAFVEAHGSKPEQKEEKDAPRTYTYDELKRLSPEELRRILCSPIVSMDCPSGFGEYEENHEFEDMTIVLLDGTTVTELEGYNGIDEMLNFDDLGARIRLVVSAQFAGWLQYEILIRRYDDDDPEAEAVGFESIQNWEPEYPVDVVLAAYRKSLVDEAARFTLQCVKREQAGLLEDDPRNPEGSDPEYGMTAETAKAFVEHNYFYDDVLARMKEIRQEEDKR